MNGLFVSTPGLSYASKIELSVKLMAWTASCKVPIQLIIEVCTVMLGHARHDNRIGQPKRAGEKDSRDCV